MSDLPQGEQPQSQQPQGQQPQGQQQMSGRPADPEALETIELAEYLRVIRNRKWTIILTTVVVVAAVLIASLLMTPMYESTAQLLRSKSNLDAALFGTRVFEVQDRQQDIQTGARIVKLETVAQRVKQELGTEKSTGLLLDAVRVEPQSGTDVVEITAESPDPQFAADLANAFAQEFISFRQETDRQAVVEARTMVQEELDQLSSQEASSEYGMTLRSKLQELQILESMQDGGFSIIQQAVVPEDPVSPQPVRNGVLGLAVGLVMGLGLAFGREYLDRGIKDEEEAERAFGVPVLASIPALGKWGSSGERQTIALGFEKSDSSPLLEAFRSLRTNLQYFDVDRSTRSILISSGSPREGKTVTTFNLGLSLALSGERVIVMEADLRRPLLHRYLGLNNSMGVSTVLTGGCSFSEALQLVRTDDYAPEALVQGKEGEGPKQALQKNLYCMTSGPLPPNPAELLGSQKMRETLAKARELADYVLVDSPPLLAVPDAAILAPHLDGTVVVALIGETTVDGAGLIHTQLERARSNFFGVVVTGIKPTDKRYRGYYGYDS